MERTYRIMIEQHLKKLNAEVTMAAWSSFAPGNGTARSKPHYNKLVYVISGEGWLELNRKRYEAKTGSLFLLPAGLEQSFGAEGTEPLEIYWVHFEANLGNAELLSVLRLPVRVDMAEQPEIIRHFESMIDAYNDSSITSTLRMKAALFETIACFLDHCRVDEEAFANIDLFAKMTDVLNYIDEHLADNVSLGQLARIACLHPNYFISLFKNFIGYSPIQYVNMQRLEAAKQMLAETDIHVADIAAAVGMQNHYLSRLFKQHTGISPTRYRQIYRDRLSRDDDPGASKELTAGGRGKRA